MENVLEIAKYIKKKYKLIYKKDIDEMKMHKLLYFIQRESLIENRKPIFDAKIYAWKYGPVIIEIRKNYKNIIFENNKFRFNNPDTVTIINRVFKLYASKNSWSLSRLTNAEFSWEQARIGLDENESGNNIINIDSIKKDAAKIKFRRSMLSKIY